MDEHVDRVRLKYRFDTFAGTLLNEGHSEAEVVNGMLRSLCSYFGDRQELMARVEVISEQWFGEPEE